MGEGGGFWIFILLLVVFHLALRITLGLGGAAPDLLTVALLLGARASRPAVAAGLGLLLGILRDALAVSGLGPAALTLSLLGFLGSRTRDLFEGGSVLFAGIYLFLGKWLHDVLFAFLTRELLGEGMGRLLLVQVPLQALYAAVAGATLLALYRAVARN